MSRQVINQAAPPEPSPALRAWAQLLRGHAATTRLLGAELQEHGLTINDYEALLSRNEIWLERTQNIEALLILRASYYTYDRPKTNLDLATQYFPSLSDPGRHRLQLDASMKRELWKDFFLSLSVYATDY